jgi:uncharacterized repeat protein (TIGR01451 family)
LLKQGDILKYSVKISNSGNETVMNPLIRFTIPSAFTPLKRNLKKLAETGKIGKFEIRSGKINIYMNNLPGGSQKTIAIELLAVMPGKTTVPPAEVYEYYNPENNAFSSTEKIEVTD